MRKPITKYSVKKLFSPPFLAYLIVDALYMISLMFMAMGIVVLVIILLFGGIDINNARVPALGILLFFPLRYLKKRLEMQRDIDEQTVAKSK